MDHELATASILATTGIRVAEADAVAVAATVDGILAALGETRARLLHFDTGLVPFQVVLAAAAGNE